MVLFFCNVQLYLLQNSRKIGPVDSSELTANYAQGKVSADTLVWWDGQSDWISLSNYFAAFHDKNVQGRNSSQVIIIREAQPMSTKIDASITGLRSSGLAYASLICGILSFFMLFPALPAIILGHMARGQIKRNSGLEGEGMATAGLIIGYLVTIFAIIPCILFLLYWLVIIIGAAALFAMFSNH